MTMFINRRTVTTRTTNGSAPMMPQHRPMMGMQSHSIFGGNHPQTYSRSSFMHESYGRPPERHRRYDGHDRDRGRYENQGSNGGFDIERLFELFKNFIGGNTAATSENGQTAQDPKSGVKNLKKLHEDVTGVTATKKAVKGIGKALKGW